MAQLMRGHGAGPSRVWHGPRAGLARLMRAVSLIGILSWPGQGLCLTTSPRPHRPPQRSNKFAIAQNGTTRHRKTPGRVEHRRLVLGDSRKFGAGESDVAAAVVHVGAGGGGGTVIRTHSSQVASAASLWHGTSHGTASGVTPVAASPWESHQQQRRRFAFDLKHRRSKWPGVLRPRCFKLNATPGCWGWCDSDGGCWRRQQRASVLPWLLSLGWNEKLERKTR